MSMKTAIDCYLATVRPHLDNRAELLWWLSGQQLAGVDLSVVWVPCVCNEWWCVTCDDHAWACVCPSLLELEELGIDPYDHSQNCTPYHDDSAEMRH